MLFIYDENEKTTKMSFWDIEPEDWFRKYLFGSGRGDIFGQFDEMRNNMERFYEEQFKVMQTKTPKDLVREYETPEGGKVREMGPFVYGVFNDNWSRWKTTSKRIW
jgi:HSP20 family protein